MYGWELRTANSRRATNFLELARVLGVSGTCSRRESRGAVCFRSLPQQGRPGPLALQSPHPASGEFFQRVDLVHPRGAGEYPRVATRRPEIKSLYGPSHWCLRAKYWEANANRSAASTLATVELLVDALISFPTLPRAPFDRGCVCARDNCESASDNVVSRRIFSRFR